MRLPLGQRQRLSLAVAMIHGPEMLILDEPTSGADPVARDTFWRIMIDLSRRDGVTIFISTHFMNEAERCDRISLMHAGRVLVSDSPAALIAAAQGGHAGGRLHRLPGGSDGRRSADPRPPPRRPRHRRPAPVRPPRPGSRASSSACAACGATPGARRWSCAVIPSASPWPSWAPSILMLVMGYGINMDVENLSFAVLDRDQTTLSRDYALNLAGSRYFVAQPPLADYADLERRLRGGKLALALEIPPGFARDVARGRPVEIGAWIDGAMPAARRDRAQLRAGHARAVAHRPGAGRARDPSGTPAASRSASATTPTCRASWPWGRR